MGDIFGGSGAKAASKAADAQTAAIEKQIAFQRESRDKILDLQAPWQEAGVDAIGLLSSIVGIEPPEGSAIAGTGDLAARRATIQQQFEDSPIYQNVYQNAIGEGTKSLERLASARGNLYSGSTLRGIEDYAGQLGANTWNQYQNTISGVAGVGQQATGQSQNAIQNASNTIGQGYADIGNAQAQGIYNAAQSRQQGWNNLFKLAGSAPQAIMGYQDAYQGFQ